eukprot:7765032-Alexandrium_andersonii.AAC.1
MSICTPSFNDAKPPTTQQHASRPPGSEGGPVPDKAPPAHTGAAYAGGLGAGIFIGQDNYVSAQHTG